MAPSSGRWPDSLAGTNDACATWRHRQSSTRPCSGAAASTVSRGPPDLCSEAGALDKAPPGNQAVHALLSPSVQPPLSDAIRTSYLAAGGGHPGAPPSQRCPPSRSRSNRSADTNFPGPGRVPPGGTWARQLVWVGPCSMQARADLAAGHRGEALPEDCTPRPGTRWCCAASGITLRRGQWRSLPPALPGSSPSLQPPGLAHAFTSYKADVLPFFKMYLLFVETLFCKYSNLALYVNLFHVAHLEAFPDPHTESAQFTVTAPGTAPDGHPPGQPTSGLLPVRQLRHADPLGMSRPCRLSPRAASLPAVPSDVVTGQRAAVSRSQAAVTQVEGGELGLLKPKAPNPLRLSGIAARAVGV